MKHYLPDDVINTIISLDVNKRNIPLRKLLEAQNSEELIHTADILDAFRTRSENLYHRVRATFFLYSLYRYFLIGNGYLPEIGHIPYVGVQEFSDSNYEQAIKIFRKEALKKGYNEAICSALSTTYYRLAFYYLSMQVRKSIKKSEGNKILFQSNSTYSTDFSSTFSSNNNNSTHNNLLNKNQINASLNFPFRTPNELTITDEKTGLAPILIEKTGVRVDPSHSGWSDIFFLGMDFPEGARVINLSVNLARHSDKHQTDGKLIKPPIESYCRYTDEPIIRITSLDLNESKEIHDIEEIFNFASDHLALLKAGIISAGIIPPFLEGTSLPLQYVLSQLLGKIGGFELITWVHDIPKGSRLAVSTSLLACIIANCMRFSGQIEQLEGSISEKEKRLVASRAILGEWLGGSGGGWQDSGGIWPGIKIIKGRLATENAPEYGISRGTLLPEINVLNENNYVQDLHLLIKNSLVLFHGGISQNVGPILEMVTEKYLLREEKEWKARMKGYNIFDQIVQAIKTADMKLLGTLTDKNFQECLLPIIPWVTNSFTDELRKILSEKWKNNLWGFIMLGGMTGGGMAFIINPKSKQDFIKSLKETMIFLKRKYENAIPFAIEPLVYDFSINKKGIHGCLVKGSQAVLPPKYYLHWSEFYKRSRKEINGTRLREFKFHDRQRSFFKKDLQSHRNLNLRTFNKIINMKKLFGFDYERHEKLRRQIKQGIISVRKNCLPIETIIEDVKLDDIILTNPKFNNKKKLEAIKKIGEKALQKKQFAVVTFAAGIGSRWTEGAGVVKIINPFVKIGDNHRSFLEIHLAKSKKSSHKYQAVQHIFTTSFLTSSPIKSFLQQNNYFNYPGKIYLSKAVMLEQRFYPPERELSFIWKEVLQKNSSKNYSKTQRNIYESMINWVKEKEEVGDYSENDPKQLFYPPGHWYEIPAMLRNGTLAKLLIENPELKYLFIHNADTLGAWLEPLILGLHINSKKMISFEVTPYRFEDAGGGLARINGKLRLVEGLALPKSEDRYKLSYYNSLTSILTIDSFLNLLNLNRNEIIASLSDNKYKIKIKRQLQNIEEYLPTYATIKNVKFRWGVGQEDNHQVLQCEKLWGDITSIPTVEAQFLAVPRFRGQQLKDKNQLDSWLREGSVDYIRSIAEFND